MRSRPGAGGARGLDRLPEIVRAEVRRLTEGAGDGPVVVAFSGGLDSCVLLHALRFSGPARHLIAAHFDHAMRKGSEGDAAWAAGVCRAWDVPFRRARASGPLRSEEDARTARYDFLFEVFAETGAAAIATAHHADDLAETVLFRVLRGTGVEGLRGIPDVRDGVVRPLLGVWREDLLRYANDVGLRWREDPTNEHVGYARNALRHDFLPALEKRVAPGARRALVRLARHADDDANAWREALDLLLREVGFDGVSIDADRTASLGPALRARLLRSLAVRSGARLDQAATARAVRFAAEGRSGTAIELGGGVELRRELDRLLVRAVRSVGVDDDRELAIEDPGPGQATVVVGGRPRAVRWWPGSRPGDRTERSASRAASPERAHFPVERVRFPLHVRGRRPGDRIRLAAGTRPLKKLLIESRVPSLERATIPIVEDADGRLLWVAGVAQAADVAEERAGTPTMTVEIEE